MTNREGSLQAPEQVAETTEPDFAGPFDAQPMRVVDGLSLGDVKDLMSGKILAIVRHHYLAHTVCEHAAAQVTKNARMENYQVEEVKRHGISVMDAAMDPDLAKLYFADSRNAMKDLRRMFSPFGSVVDQLHAEIDETWPAGARIMTVPFHGASCKLKRGTCREFPAGQKIDPHHDNFYFDACKFAEAPHVRLQLSFNVYLRVASGGELVVYPRRIQTPEEELSLRDPRSRYGLRSELLGTPLEIQPAEGDLIVFCANRAHTVKPSFGGSRVTASLFAGLVDDEQPLLLFN